MSSEDDLYKIREGNGTFTLINKELLEERFPDELERRKRLLKIRSLMFRKAMMFTDMRELDKESDLKQLQFFDKKIQMLEFELQEAWGFPKDAKYHRFWERPYCSCPILDNRDAIGTGFNVININCPLHGKIKDK